jgi:hypothetical protein
VVEQEMNKWDKLKDFVEKRYADDDNKGYRLFNHIMFGDVLSMMQRLESEEACASLEAAGY